MKKYEIGLYEKAMRNTLTWKEKLQCAKECGYDYLEISIDATEERSTVSTWIQKKKERLWKQSSIRESR